MQQTHLADFDLNKLVALQILLEERHITRAARRAFLSQPAMSRVLARLRDSFGDDLIVRTGRRYERTPRGERLLHELGSLLPRLEALVRGGKFDPAKAREKFRVAGTDYAAAVIVAGVVRRLRREAPNMQVDMMAWTADSYQQVEAGSCELALGVGSAPTPSASLKVEVLYEEEFVCLVDAKDSFPKKRFSLAEYLRRSHASFTVLDGQQAMVDRPLADQGKMRTVAFRSSYALATALAVVGSDLVFTVPRRLASKILEVTKLRQIGPPKEIANFPYVMVWHPRLHGDPAHIWFREQVRAVFPTRKGSK